eukprot:scaffold200518_cov28-Tisochrysis_lutea.AAC.3
MGRGAHSNTVDKEERLDGRRTGLDRALSRPVPVDELVLCAPDEAPARHDGGRPHRLAQPVGDEVVEEWAVTPANRVSRCRHGSDARCGRVAWRERFARGRLELIDV